MKNFTVIYVVLTLLILFFILFIAYILKYKTAYKRTKLEAKGEEKIYKYIKQKYPDSKIYRNVFFRIDKDKAIRIDDILVTKRAVYLLRSETRKGVIWMEPELKGATFVTRKTFKLWTDKYKKKRAKFLSPYRINESPRRLFNYIAKYKIPYINISVFINDNLLVCEDFHKYDDCVTTLEELDKVIEYWENQYSKNNIDPDEAIGIIRKYKRKISRLKAEKIFLKNGPYILC